MNTFKHLTQTVAFALFTFVSLSAFSSNKIKTSVVHYHGSMIPSVALKEINIEGSKNEKGQLCAMISINGKMIPSVQLSEITVHSNNLTDKQVVTAIEPVVKSKLLPTVKINGSYIASVTLEEVQVVANSSSTSDKQTNNDDVSEKSNDHFANVSVKQSFNRIMNYFVEKTKTAANKLLNSLFNK